MIVIHSYKSIVPVALAGTMLIKPNVLGQGIVNIRSAQIKFSGDIF